MKQMTTYIFSALVAISLSSPLFAHGDHCHKKAEDGKLTDWKGHKDQKACEEAGGVWRDHHIHCHKAGDDGKMSDFTEAKSKKACLKSGGKWSDHGHEGLQD
jgi:hypothetical protein